MDMKTLSQNTEAHQSDWHFMVSFPSNKFLEVILRYKTFLVVPIWISTSSIILKKSTPWNLT